MNSISVDLSQVTNYNKSKTNTIYVITIPYQNQHNICDNYTLPRVLVSSFSYFHDAEK